ncbi:hypothetical protein Fleli_2802 [Bernardetia litoralis DSM 6794]|uniref:DUF4199 domain-containing protein n=1 Tax=Bernardetia litoralis (strain ATCC 23117 / DSM 6794 / NBRC 15988 / NCIMB 1366 / Fx l1 / Sio-4) TaxID=880071 RepID=I4AMH0_BERLS|nr:DUF4199 domain-containing protein [Bernardetia litoralis]AFM05155.1 hypothetical protein Fleli_2802 [Bernardetia litoralis DSM 6794]
MKNPFWKYAFLTAATMAVGVLLLTVTLHLFGENPFKEYEFMFMPIYFGLLVWGLFRYRKNVMKGYLEGWRAIGFGLVANFVAIILYCGLLYGFLRTVPEALERHQLEVDAYNITLRKVAKEHMEETEKLSTVLLDASETNDRITPAVMAVDKFFKMGAIGFVIVMVAGLFMMKRKPEVPENNIPIDSEKGY